MAVDITRVKILLGIEDTSQDKLLRIIYFNASSVLAVYINASASTIPSDLLWVVDELTIKRFNRISNEGMVNETLAQRNVTFESDSLREYKEYLKLWLLNNPEYNTNKRLRML